MTSSFTDVNGDEITGYLKLGSTVTYNREEITYFVDSFLGCGCYGQAYRVKYILNKREVWCALKVIKLTHTPFDGQINQELRVRQILHDNFPNSPKMKHINQIVTSWRDLDYAYLVMELGALSMFDVIKLTDYYGMGLRDVQKFLRQFIHGLDLIHKCGIIHTDLKPENLILLQIPNDNKNANNCSRNKNKNENTNKNENEKDFIQIVQIIDFGLACLKKSDIPCNVQTLTYRAPEVILRMKKDNSIDIWSFGCIAAELFFGLPIFCGIDEKNCLQLMELRLGPFPKSIIENTTMRSDYFDGDHIYGDGDPYDQSELRGIYFDDEEAKTIKANLENLVRRRGSIEDEEAVEKFLDLLLSVLKYIPEERLTTDQIIDHPFMQMSFD